MSTKTKKAKSILLTDIVAIGTRVGEVNGRATTHTASAREIYGMTAALEELRTKTLLPKVSAVGMRVELTTEGPWASSYQYAVTGGHAVFVYTKKGWALASYEKVGVYPKSKRRVQVHVSEVQAEEIRRRSTAWLVIDKPRPASTCTPTPVVKLVDWEAHAAAA